MPAHEERLNIALRDSENSIILYPRWKHVDAKKNVVKIKFSDQGKGFFMQRHETFDIFSVQSNDYSGLDITHFTDCSLRHIKYGLNNIFSARIKYNYCEYFRIDDAEEGEMTVLDHFERAHKLELL